MAKVKPIDHIWGLEFTQYVFFSSYHGYAMRQVSINSTSLCKTISFQSKASVVCSVTTAKFIDFCLKKLNVFSKHNGKKQINIWISQSKSQGNEMLI